MASFVTLCPGQLAYAQGLQLQELLLQERREKDSDVLLLLEHPPVITLGRGGTASNLRLPEATLVARGIPVHRVGRGGDVTYHGPGQLVGYPIVRLDGPRVVDYVRALEELNLRMLARHRIDARRVDGLTGVWTDEGKVTAIGVRVTAGRVTQHGWATNVGTDLGHFSGIVPCGIDDRPVTSMNALGAEADMATVLDDTIAAIEEVFATTLDRADLTDLPPDLRPGIAHLDVAGRR
jgi:lipoate-protein ligase B